MAEDNNIVLATKEQGLGEVRIAPEVIEVIIGIAASQVEGVCSMRGSLANSLTELIGRKNRGRGVKLGNTEDGLLVDVYVFLNYGCLRAKGCLRDSRQGSSTSSVHDWP